jgi:inner membrane protein involved in colicin E2 resistance
MLLVGFFIRITFIYLFMIYLVSPSLAHIIQHKIVGKLLDNKL